MSQVLYRKYRPQTFADVVGQDHIVKTLSSQVSLGTIGHAYVFAGSRGTGKTSIARILARELGTSSNDLYEIDSASNNGVDEMRELNESVHTLPFDSKYKVYILDEVHMLSKSASNALLKTLEEPPAHVIFILATTETHKIPETVLSRCQVYSFKKPNQSTLKTVVSTVAKKEGYTIADSSADLIALIGDGSFRDTLGTLQKILSSSKDKNISEDEVLLVTGAPQTSLVNELVSSLVYKKLDTALETVQKISDKNVDMPVLLKLLLQKMRSLLLVRFGSETLVKNVLSEEDLSFIKTLASDTSAIVSSSDIVALLDAYTATHRAYIASLPLELALMSICTEKNI
jgi:DNA polymerase-3 subunit gamma/tau